MSISVQIYQDVKEYNKRKWNVVGVLVKQRDFASHA